ncbi:MAG: dodecin domain-containing protein [Alphaproteobacteria bacterium]|nr:dodecin domain-containing protein [Alphaproteobacteria bacterium]MCB9928533.1 dodecin domain-containing protein [Alphaproteobacteria bacterium]
MSNVYKVTEIVGTSEESISDAIQSAIAKAGESIRNLEWFEVGQVRGWIKDDKVGHYQVTMKIGFKYDK